MSLSVRINVTVGRRRVWLILKFSPPRSPYEEGESSEIEREKRRCIFVIGIPAGEEKDYDFIKSSGRQTGKDSSNGISTVLLRQPYC